MKNLMLILIIFLLTSSVSMAGKPHLTPEQVIRKYGLLHDERRNVWIYDSRQYGVMWYGYYDYEGNFRATHRQVNALADFRSLYPTNYRRFFESQPTTPVRYRNYP